MLNIINDMEINNKKGPLRGPFLYRLYGQFTKEP